MLNLLLPLALSLSSSASPNDRCSALVGTCEYYSCVEAERIACGDQGYALGYGVKYCNKLSSLVFEPSKPGLNADTFPGDGNEWRDNVRTCLQTEMEGFFASGEPVTCESLRAFAFGSHPSCYTQGPSFCELNAEAVVKVGFTIGPKDLLTAESFTQVADTARICSAQLGERIEREDRLLVRLNLEKYQAIWNIIAADPLEVGRYFQGQQAKARP